MNPSKRLITRYQEAAGAGVLGLQWLTEQDWPERPTAGCLRQKTGWALYASIYRRPDEPVFEPTHPTELDEATTVARYLIEKKTRLGVVKGYLIVDLWQQRWFTEVLGQIQTGRITALSELPDIAAKAVRLLSRQATDFARSLNLPTDAVLTLDAREDEGPFGGQLRTRFTVKRAGAQRSIAFQGRHTVHSVVHGERAAVELASPSLRARRIVLPDVRGIAGIRRALLDELPDL